MGKWFGPAGMCDACSRGCMTMDQVGIRCYHCHQGIFMSRAFWTFWTDEWGVQWGTPRQDFDLAALEVERERIRQKCGSDGEPHSDLYRFQSAGVIGEPSSVTCLTPPAQVTVCGPVESSGISARRAIV